MPLFSPKRADRDARATLARWLDFASLGHPFPSLAETAYII
jgi:hypothetical protein